MTHRTASAPEHPPAFATSHVEDNAPATVSKPVVKPRCDPVDRPIKRALAAANHAQADPFAAFVCYAFTAISNPQPSCG